MCEVNLKLLLVFVVIGVLFTSGCISNRDKAEKEAQQAFEDFVKSVEECEGRATPHYWSNSGGECISELDKDNCLVLEEWDSVESEIYPDYYEEDKIQIKIICNDQTLIGEYETCEAGFSKYRIKNNKVNSMALVCWR